MAVLKLSTLTDHIAGKMNGTVFQKTGATQVMRVNSFGQNKKTTRQRIQQTKLQRSAQLWRSLSETEKNSYVSQIPNYPYTNKVGDTSYYNAYQLFQKLNVPFYEENGTINSIAPVYTPVANSEIVDLDLNIGDYLMYYNGDSGIQKVRVFASPPLVNAPLSLYNDLRFLSEVTSVNPFGVTNLFSEYLSVFEPITLGKTVQFAIKGYNPITGELSPFLSWLNGTF